MPVFITINKILRMYNGTLTNFTLSKLTTGYIITLEVVLASMSLGKGGGQKKMSLLVVFYY